MTRPTLTVIVEHKLVSRMNVTATVTVGRLADNSLILADTSVSGHHGRLEKIAAGWRYTDLGSSNGSLIAAGPRLGKDEGFVICEVTQILVGSTVLEFDPKDENSEQEPRGSTSVSFEGSPSADVRRRGSGARGRSSETPGSRPLAEQGLGNATTGFSPGVCDPTPPGSQLAQSAGSDPRLDPQLPDHPHRLAPPRPQPDLSLADSETGPGSGAASSGTPPQASVPNPALTRTPLPPATRQPRAQKPNPKTSVVVLRGQGPEPSKPVQPATQSALPLRLTARVLVVLGDTVTTVELKKPVNLIGRSRHCDVVIDHDSVSSRHSEISTHEGRWRVSDLGSTNGTRLGLVRLEEPHQLPSHCHLILGAADLLFIHDRTDGPDDLDDERFLVWLRRRHKLTRSQAKSARLEAARVGRGVGEVLVAQGVLKPGPLIELSHNAGLAARTGGQIPRYAWGLFALAAVVAAVAFFVLS